MKNLILISLLSLVSTSVFAGKNKSCTDALKFSDPGSVSKPALINLELMPKEQIVVDTDYPSTKEDIEKELNYFKDSHESQQELLKNQIKSGVSMDAIASSERHLDWLKNQIKKLDEKFNKVLDKANQKSKDKPTKEKFFDEIEAKFKENPELARHLEDFLNFKAIKRLDDKRISTLLVGSPRTKTSKRDLENGTAALNELMVRGYYVFLDGHSPATPALLKQARGQAIAITRYLVKGIPKDQQVVISNSFLYLSALKHCRDMMATFSSTTGVAMALYEKLDVFLGNKDQDFKALDSWVYNLSGWNIALKFWRTIKENRDPLDYIKRNIWTEYKFDPKDSAFKPISYRDIDRADLQEAVEYANHMVEGYEETKGPQAVVFGSGSMNKKSSPFIYEVAFELGKAGVGVASGGAGGAMLAANMGAYDAGGVSLGIPLAFGKLKTESKTFSEVQTKTVAAHDYEDRIPWLLNGRKLIINAPGGNGTMREIVTSLVYLSTSENPDAVMIFLRKNFYGPLVKWIQSLPIDPEVKDRVIVVDSVDELRDAVSSAISEKLIGKLHLEPAKEPRSKRKALPEHHTKEHSYSSTSYSSSSTIGGTTSGQDDGPSTSKDMGDDFEAFGID